MRVAVLASYAPSLIRFRGRLIEQMVRGGHTVVGCSPGSDAGVERALAAYGAAYASIPLARTGLNPVADTATLVHLVSFFRRWKPHLLLAYTQKPVIYGCLAARAAGVPHVFAMITGLGFSFTEGPGLKRRLLRQTSRTLYSAALRVANGVFFQNPDDLAEFKRLGIVSKHQNLIHVDGSGVDTAQFPYIAPRAWPPVFLLIARLIGDKGIREYVEAARIVRARCPEARVQLLGPLDSNPTAISAAELQRWQDEGVVEYLGQTEDVRPYLARSTVYVLPSYYREGVPRTNLEAMATGRAIITTQMPGCRETVIDGENGFLVPARDPQAIAEAMLRFVLQPEIALEMGRRSRKIVEERFDVNRINALMLDRLGLA